MAGQNAVSSDPGSAYLKGLTAELQAAVDARKAWEDALAGLRAGLEQWETDPSPVGIRNTRQYLAAIERAMRRWNQADDRATKALADIRDQQASNLRDYTERVALGLASPSVTVTRQ